VNKTRYILFQIKWCRQKSELKILIKNRETVNVKSTNFLRVIIDSNLSWEVHIKNICSRISHDLFINNRLSKIVGVNVRKMLYFGLIYLLLAYGIVVWGQSAKTLDEYLPLKKNAVRYTAGLKQQESRRDSFRQLQILIYLLYIQEPILYAK
jgi:hypothetical protein